MILITGGAGYIGSHVAKLLYKRGYKTLVLDNLSNGYKELVRWSPLIQGDMGYNPILEELFNKYHIEAIMHFAAFIEVGESVKNPIAFYQNNFSNALNLIKYAHKYGVKHFIFSSTAAVFGEPVMIPIAEDHPCSPINPYGRSKYMVEMALSDLAKASEMKYVIFRYFNAAGADPECETGERHYPETHLIPIILEVAQELRPVIKVFGRDYNTKDGTCIRDYIHVQDLAEAHVLGLEYIMAGNKSDVFNLGNGQGFSVQQVIEIAQRITGQKIPVENAERRKGDPAILVSSSEKIKSVLGWKPAMPDLETIIKTAWDWCRSDMYKEITDKYLNKYLQNIISSKIQDES